jgi:hypothetical protein
MKIRTTENNMYYNKTIPKWSLEKKITCATIITLLSIVGAGFITFGETLNQIATLNRYMDDTRQREYKVAAIEAKIEDINIHLNNIENYLLNGKK